MSSKIQKKMFLCPEKCRVLTQIYASLPRLNIGLKNILQDRANSQRKLGNLEFDFL